MDCSPKPARTIGRYAIFAEIASGGMASVHIGRLMGPVGFSRTVAIKRLHPQFARDPEFVTMFLDEARLAARIRHPNVASTLDVVATQGELFLVMEYIQGESLAQLLKITNEAGKTVPHDIVRTIMSGVLHGLHAAHEANSERGEPLGIVHRDVSPQNILVGTDGIARLLDFGIAKAASRAHVTRDRHIKGKLSYMAPEQIQNTEIDRRVDVYAAAVVTWEMLTGKRLFLAESESGTLARVLTTSVVPPSAESRTVSFKLDQVVLRGLKRAREGRYATAREMALALESSGRLATASAVGEWVEQTAHAALAARAADIAAVEQIEEVPAGATSSQSLPVARKLELVNEPTADAPAPTADAPALTAHAPAPATEAGVWREQQVAAHEAEPMSEPDVARDEDIHVEDEPPTKPEPVAAFEVERSSCEQSSAPDERLSHGDIAAPNHKRRRLTAIVGLLAVLTSLLVWFGLAGSTGGRAATHAAKQRSAHALAPAGSAAAVRELPPETQPNEQASEAIAAQPAASAAAEPAKPVQSDTQATVHKTDSKPVAGSQTQGMTRSSNSKTTDCSPPYTVDEAGIRHYKRKCL